MLKKYSIPLFFFLAYLFTWSNWLPQALASRGIATYEPTEAIALLAGYGPALAAIIVALLTAGRQGLGELFGRLLRWRVGLHMVCHCPVPARIYHPGRSGIKCHHGRSGTRPVKSNISFRTARYIPCDQDHRSDSCLHTRLRRFGRRNRLARLCAAKTHGNQNTADSKHYSWDSLGGLAFSFCTDGRRPIE